MQERLAVDLYDRMRGYSSGETPLTPVQQEAVIRCARMYLRNSGIAITEPIFRAAMGVMGDATRRGLARAGRKSLKPSEGVGPLIKEGLALREQIHINAEEILAGCPSRLKEDERFLGPFALESGTVGQAQKEIKNFMLTPSLTASETIIAQVHARSAIIDRFAARALGELPQEMRAASLDAFPDRADRARLVRNMIASYMFRGTLSPLIISEDLVQFIAMTRPPAVVEFNPQEFAALCGALSLATDGDEREYMRCLFDQTAFIFDMGIPFPKHDEPTEMYRFYRQFSYALLLLNPELEKEEIVVVPKEVKSGKPSLWDQSIRFGNAFVPEPASFMKAVAQARAKQNRGREHNLSEGLNAWKWYQKENQNRLQKIEKWEEVLLEQETLLSHLDDPAFPLPPRAYTVIFKNQEAARVKMTVSARELRREQAVIQANIARQEECARYKQDLTDRYGDALPATLPIVRSQYTYKMGEEMDDLKGEQASIKYMLGRIERLIDNTFLVDQKHGYIFLSVYGSSTVDAIGVELVDTRKTLFEARGGLGYMPYSGKNLKRLVKRLEMSVSGKTRAKRPMLMPNTLKTYYQFFIRQIEVFKSKKFQALPEDKKGEVWREFVCSTLGQRIELLTLAREMLIKHKALAPQIQDLRSRIDDYEKDPERKIPDDVSWTREEAMAYFSRVRAMDMTDVLQTADENFLKTSRRMIRVLAHIKPAMLPRVIGSRQHLRMWLNNRIPQGEESVQSIKNEGRGTATALRQLDVQKGLLELIDSVLIPDGPGMERKVFIYVLRERARFTHAMLSFEKQTADSALATQAFEKLMRASFKIQLRSVINANKKEMEALKARSIEAEFVDRMQTLGFVLDSNSES